MKKIIIISISAFLLNACAGTSQSSAPEKSGEKSIQSSQKELEGLSTAYFASGCFWCVEAVFESVQGVEEAVSGYAGGHTENPTYQSIGTGRTGHAESVKVYYDSDIVDYSTLLKVYYGSHDPTTVNGQEPDFGTQYRSIIFYQNEEEKKITEDFKKRLASSGQYDNPIVTEIVQFEKFYEAEEYHQDYERRNPTQSYVRNVSVPRLNRFKEKFPDLLKEGH